MSVEIRRGIEPGSYVLAVRDGDDDDPALEFPVSYAEAQRLNRDIVRLVHEDDAYLAAVEAEYERQMMRGGR